MAVCSKCSNTQRSDDKEAKPQAFSSAPGLSLNTHGCIVSVSVFTAETTGP